ncbi:hypothetical protein Vi05172_g12224 [Venturia inaequalis]|nr:hypothetical protein Vi05172_g12224 [Venturia inaequalis]
MNPKRVYSVPDDQSSNIDLGTPLSADNRVLELPDDYDEGNYNPTEP